jgi:hypothetical protein
MDLDESLEEVAVFLILFGYCKEALLVDQLVFVKESVWDYGHVEFLFFLVVVLLILLIVLVMDLQEA